MSSVKKHREMMAAIRESVGREAASSNTPTIWKRLESLGDKYSWKWSMANTSWCQRMRRPHQVIDQRVVVQGRLSFRRIQNVDIRGPHARPSDLDVDQFRPGRTWIQGWTWALRMRHANVGWELGLVFRKFSAINIR